VYASGGIESGESGNDLLSGPTLGSTTLIRDLDRAFHAPGVRAVVFRIESPGGSALASNLIHHELDRLQRETRKPLAVSMGSVAASGGYYIAVPARRIFADKSTRTGSIGVLFVHPSFEGWYAKHGVRQDEFERGAYMRGGSPARDWDAATQAAADSAIARSYETFVTKVADGRHLPRERVHELAQGRVWLGDDARERGLVDEIGGLDAAIRWARDAAGLDPHERFEPLEFRRPAPGFLQRIAGGWLREQVGREAQLHDISGTRFESDDDFAF
jgi:protease-4